MLSTFILSIVSLLQSIKFEYLYSIFALYLLLFWISYGIWVWKDTGKRYTNALARGIVWAIVTITFVFGFFLYILSRPQLQEEDTYWVDLERQYLIYETYGMGKCRVCQTNLRPEFLYCPECGNVLRKKCAQCENIIDVSWDHCPYCNTLQAKKEAIAAEKTIKQSAFLLVYSALFVWIKKAIMFLKENILAVPTTSEALPMQIEKKPTKKTTTKKSKRNSKKQQNPTIEKVDKLLEESKKLIFIEEKVHSKK